MEGPVFYGSAKVTNPALDLFSVPPTDFGVISSDYQQVLPYSPVNGRSTPINFRIDKTSNGFIDLRDSFLHLKANIRRADGSAFTSAEDVAPENLFLHTLVQNVNVKLNGVNVCETSGLYPYQAWILKQLTNGIGVKGSESTKELYFRDDNPDSFSGTSYQSRLKVGKLSKSFEMIGRISDSIFDLERYLPNNVVVDVELTFGEPEFCLSTSEDIKAYVYIEDAQLYIRRRSIHPETIKSIQLNFSKGYQALYPYRKTEIRSVHIPKGINTFVTESSVFRGILPDVLCLGLVSHDAFRGSLKKSPFNFQNFNLSSLTVTIDDMPVVYRSIECNYEKNEYLMGYNTLKATRGSLTGNHLTTEDYLKGNTLYVLDLSNSKPLEFHTDRVGEIKVLINFSKELTETVTLVIFGQLQSMFAVDKSGRVEIERRET